MNETIQLKKRILALINQINKTREEKDLSSQSLELMEKLEKLRELELIEKMPGEYLQAYLLYKQAFYSNYQSKNLQILDKDAYLEKLSQEIALIEEAIQKSTAEPDNEKLLVLLGKRIEAKEIISIWNKDNAELILPDGTLVVNLKTGKVVPNRVKEFLEKYEIEQKEVKHE
ncbi:hypothetical protein [endosymbiont GvMRE of Glomus versiforme]|uniref:hypothetical protein n=1 Tax=endosymbiont GvMRE of Glomus versiforme TaxID=2039283 RepID=UPI000ECE5AF6|nr:hypothetical protein [endosymbiont GvMRE of Glomus versiforme]RHZ37219.1 hypothetical protein GvMRE_I1g469 [endosymbiont GvMRE of Glomus versiforme]